MDVLRKPIGIFNRKTSFEKREENCLGNVLIIQCLVERVERASPMKRGLKYELHPNESIVGNG